ncbi:MAG: hypothetical protein AAFY91_17130, partial [Bacteroidota bacterium]
FRIKRFSSLYVSVATVAFCIIFEFLFPFLDSRFTADWRDIIAYILGSLCFYFLINPRCGE